MDPEELEGLEDALAALVSGFGSGRSEVTADLSDHRSRLTARSLAAAARIEDEAGSDDPEVVELRARFDESDRLRVAANLRVVREERRSRPERGQWLAYGRLLDATGQPAAGFKIRIVDPTRTPSKLGEAQSDEFGEWAVTYPECPPGEGKEESAVVVRIHGARNKLVYSSDGDFTLGPEPVEFLEIVLPPGAAPGVGGGKEPPSTGPIRVTPPRDQPVVSRPVRPPAEKPGKPPKPAEGGPDASGGGAAEKPPAKKPAAKKPARGAAKKPPAKKPPPTKKPARGAAKKPSRDAGEKPARGAAKKPGRGTTRRRPPQDKDTSS